ncbi:MAG: PIG-L family deacetylase [Elusimicrobia bacterium]|nr:PIG-L family deacetylase [Elusimicrobiota bacterium]
MFAPHPDDEMLGAGGILRDAALRAAGGEDVDYRVVLFTCGDGYPDAVAYLFRGGLAQDLDGNRRFDFIDLGIMRCRESLKALSSIGVPRGKVVFLGYPDGGLDKIPAKPGTFRGPLTRAERVPYPFAQSPGAPYQRESVLRDLRRVLTAFQPTAVYTPTVTDCHLDHSSVRNFVKEALSETHSRAEHWEYLIHWEQKEPAWPYASLRWKSPAGHIPPDLVVPLSRNGWSAKEKRIALERYVSQVGADPVVGTPFWDDRWTLSTAWRRMLAHLGFGPPQANDTQYLLDFAKDDEVFWRSRANPSDYLVPAAPSAAKR